jgi:hypothetical protein
MFPTFQRFLLRPSLRISYYTVATGPHVVENCSVSFVEPSSMENETENVPLNCQFISHGLEMWIIWKYGNQEEAACRGR